MFLFRSRLGHWLFWFKFSWFPPIPPAKFWGSTSIKLIALPSKSFPVHNSSVIIPFDTVLSNYWQRFKIIHAQSSRDSVAGIAPSYGLDNRGIGVGVPVGSRIFSPLRPDRLWGPLNLLSNGYRGALSPGVKRSGREAHHSPSTCAEVKILWIYISSPPYAFMA
jgi:hypothetical protein